MKIFLLYKLSIITFFLSIMTPQFINGQNNFSLKDYYSEDELLSQYTENVYASLTDTQRIAQMIIVALGEAGKPISEVKKIVKSGYAGGVILLKGHKDDFTQWIGSLNEIAATASTLPILYSTDAEPSLINYKIKGIPTFPKTNTIKTVQESDSIARAIDRLLKEIGVAQNFAPIVDYATNMEVIGNRSYGTNLDELKTLSNSFMQATQADGIVATAKHFPGHGNVQGDSHKQLVYIDGELKELDQFTHLIDQGVISVMVGHIAVINNQRWNTENGWPSSCSRKIVTDLLKGELGFKGIVVTDAMNMEAVNKIGRPSLKAARAGCDMIIMPSGEKILIASILKEIKTDTEFASQIEHSVKKIIRLKICLGML